MTQKELDALLSELERVAGLVEAASAKLEEPKRVHVAREAQRVRAVAVRMARRRLVKQSVN